MQHLIVALIVASCVVYAAWSLAPIVWRRAIATRLLRVTWPARVSAFLQKHASVSNGCGCEGCDRNPVASKAALNPALTPGRNAAPDALQPITFHPHRKPRPRP